MWGETKGERREEVVSLVEWTVMREGRWESVNVDVVR